MFVHAKNVYTLYTGNNKWCMACVWWEYSKNTRLGLFGQAAERTMEIIRLLIILITSVVSFNLFWRNEWGKLIKYRGVNVTCM